MTERLTIDIESIAAGGDGVGRHEGFVVFVPRTAPGDRAVVSVERGRRFARGRLEGLERASPVRVTPGCPHYDGTRCGGCQLQHISRAAQHEAKRAIVRDTLRRIGHRTVPLPEIHAGVREWRYRERLSLAMRRDAGGAWFGGLHAWDEPDRVFALADCRITREAVLDRWRDVLAAAGHLPPADALRVTVRDAPAGGRVTVEGGRDWPAARAFADALRGFDGIWWAPEGAKRARIDAGGGAAHGASFAQVNPEVAAALLEFVVARAADAAPVHVVDAYAGAGDLAVRLAEAGCRVTAIELDEDAAAAGAARLARPSRMITARVEDVIADVLTADVVVVNPPRAGLDARVAAAIDRAEGVRRVVYVSCDPATLARDIARMSSWEIASVDAFDMFPQTAHVEAVVVLERAGAS